MRLLFANSADQCNVGRDCRLAWRLTCPLPLLASSFPQDNRSGLLGPTKFALRVLMCPLVLKPTLIGCPGQATVCRSHHKHKQSVTPVYFVPDIRQML